MQNISYEGVYNVIIALSGYILKFKVPVFFVPPLLWLAFKAHNSNEAAEPTVTSTKSPNIHSSLNVFVVLVWILIYREHYISHDSSWFPIFDVGAPLGMLGILFVIPVGLITSCYFIEKEPCSVANKLVYIYILASRAVYIVSAIIPIWMILFYTGMALND